MLPGIDWAFNDYSLKGMNEGAKKMPKEGNNTTSTREVVCRLNDTCNTCKTLSTMP